ncbi:hypothetical protein ACFWA9_04410 [Kitasatospora sp. NPDC059973]|uniref:hypothetical protein n=1 Tax=Kitasatospora sp. NPDC059973 TaxID=3347020 RepID=UPI0036B51455
MNDLLAAAAAGRPGGCASSRPGKTRPEHRTVLERAAGAVEEATGREFVPGGEGQLDEELAYSAPTSSPAACSSTGCRSCRPASGSR